MGEIMLMLNYFIANAKSVPVPAICCVIAGIIVSLVFIVAFFLELFIPKKVAVAKEEDINIDEMLSKLEGKSKIANNAEPQVTPVVLPKQEVKEEKKEVVEDKKSSQNLDFDALFAQLEQELKTAEEDAKKQEVKETKKAEVKKEEVKADDTIVESVVNDEPNLDSLFEELEKELKTEEKKTVTTTVVETVVKGPEFDYNTRLATINSSFAKLEKDLAKATKEVNKYEKTAKRKERNEKLLDRKATELTNLNLVMYNINDIKEIDAEKKQKQEDLVKHVAELKNSIAEADEYLVKNKEKYEHSKKLKTFLDGEKQRYISEIEELNMLIENGKKKNK